MYKIAVVGDYDSIYGFAALGLDTFPVTAQEEAGERLQELAAGGYGIIYITEALAAGMKHEIARYQNQLIPAIIEIPGNFPEIPETECGESRSLWNRR